MNRYYALENELAHIHGALQLLERRKANFPPDTVIGSPAYWRKRIRSVREQAGRHKTLVDQADVLLAMVDAL
ncbi:hypothetical protein WS84_19770 [Burkholderia anthina]|uniref:hypothetical protein n=1 Tax=Burkholderia anthina TaxID=179879 RepID=UPI00075DB980|nr:hypothetical protein [Burkholderia anthina]KVH09148.1 hypothetical protein WS84_19770 [Burkholderia anthina]